MGREAEGVFRMEMPRCPSLGGCSNAASRIAFVLNGLYIF